MRAARTLLRSRYLAHLHPFAKYLLNNFLQINHEMSNHAKWSEELTIQMIIEYEKRDYLWNPVSQFYKNKSKREEGYTEIINVLQIEDVTVKELKNKIKNIRSSYSVELKKIRAARKNCSYAYKPSVTWFEHADRFLRAIVTPCSVDNSLLETIASDDSQNDAFDQHFEEDPPPPAPPKPEKKPHKRRNSSHKSAPFVLNTPSPRPITPFGIATSPFGVFPQSSPFGIIPASSGASAPFLTPPVGIATPLAASSLADIYAVPPKRRKRSAEAASSFLTDNNQLESGPQPDDEFEMFAKLIANQLRKLPLSLALDTQLKIQTLVNAARIQAVYQQYSYAGPSQETLSVTSLSNNILSNIMSQNSFSSRAAAARAMREPSLDIKIEMEESDE